MNIMVLILIPEDGRVIRNHYPSQLEELLVRMEYILRIPERHIPV
jgi:hypothetical protein